MDNTQRKEVRFTVYDHSQPLITRDEIEKEFLLIFDLADTEQKQILFASLIQNASFDTLHWLRSHMGVKP